MTSRLLYRNRFVSRTSESASNYLTSRRLRKTFKSLYQFCQTLRSQLQLEAGAIRPTNIGWVGGEEGGFEAKVNHIKTVLTMTMMYHSLPKF